jgi:hypothetical protein
MQDTMNTLSKDETVYRTCRLVVQHIRNHVETGHGGIHSRLFTHILHPERDFVGVGQSPEVLAGTEPYPEHLVPCAVLIQETRRLILEKRLADEDIARLLQKHWKIALITKEQAKHIDFELRYRSTMPPGWCFETGDTFARLNEAGITLL